MSFVASSLVRLNKLLSNKGLCSRREADYYIEQGLVKVNGTVITQLGTKVESTSEVKLLPEALRKQAQQTTILLNKPLGVISCQPERAGQVPAIQLCGWDTQFTVNPKDPPRDRFEEYLNKGQQPKDQGGWAVAGRLDSNSTGLLVLTQSGRVAQSLVSPNSTIDKEYLVRVEQILDPSQVEVKEILRKLGDKEGVLHDGERLTARKIKIVNENQLKFILTQGKNHHIRRMCEVVGLRVQAIKRVRIGQVSLVNLPVGKWRFLKPYEKFG
jgi:23S rRNA pseudouridine2604 synthase